MFTRRNNRRFLRLLGKLADVDLFVFLQQLEGGLVDGGEVLHHLLELELAGRPKVSGRCARGMASSEATTGSTR